MLSAHRVKRSLYIYIYKTKQKQELQYIIKSFKINNEI